MNFAFKIIIILFLIFGIENKIEAQISDHLEPIEEDNSLYKFEYYYSIRDGLFKGLAPKPEVRYLALYQLFQPVYEVDIEYCKDEAKYFIICHSFYRKNPAKKNIENIKLDIYKKEISKRSVDLVKGLFEAAIKGTKNDNNNRIGFDGTDYYFFVNNNEKLNGGKVWSPDKKSKMERLVKIGDQLIGIARSKKEIADFDPKFTKKIIDLTNELKQSTEK